MNNFVEALTFAQKMHKGQVRKITGEPYINHPERVTRLLAAYFPENDIICAVALLHDVIEDCYTDELSQEEICDEIYRKFGGNITKCVVELTNVYTKDKYPQLNRKKRKSLELDRICTISDLAKTVKCADRIDNLLDFTINGGMPDYYKAESAELYYEALKGQTLSPYLENILAGLIK